jgi:ankyrin repeat protein
MPIFGMHIKDITKIALLNGGRLQARTLCNEQNATPLMNAAVKDDIEKAKAALKIHKGDKKYINKQDAENGNTALHIAAFMEKLDIVKLLVAAGADITITNKLGETALTIAQYTKDAVYNYLKEVFALKQKNDAEKQAAKKKKEADKKKKSKAKKKLKQSQNLQAEKKLSLEIPQAEQQNASLEVNVPSPKTIKAEQVGVQSTAQIDEEFPGMPSNPPSPSSQTMSPQSLDEKQIAEINDDLSKEIGIIDHQNGKIFLGKKEIKDGDPLIRNLLIEISRDNIEKVDDLLKLIKKKNLDIDTVLADAFTPLQFAVQKANPIMIKKLVDAGALYYKGSSNLMTPLEMAAQIARADIGEILLKKIPLKSECILNAVGIAAQNAHFDFIVMVLKHGADLNGQTVLHYAAYHGNVQAVKKYVSHHNINIADKEGQTALDYAAHENHWDIVEYLISMHADTHGNTLLHYAATYSDLVQIQKLLAQGADVHKTNNKGQTPLLCILDSCVKGELFKPAIIALVKAGASLFARDPESNYNILEITACYLDIDLFQFLLMLYKEETKKNITEKLEILRKTLRKVNFWLSNTKQMEDFSRSITDLSREEILTKTLAIKKILEQEIARISILSSISSKENNDTKNDTLPTKKAKPKISQAERDAKRAAEKAQERQMLERAQAHYKEKNQKRALQKLKSPLLVNQKLRAMAPAFTACKAKADQRTIENSFKTWQTAFKTQNDEKAKRIAAQKEAEAFRIMNVQQKVIHAWKQYVASKKNKRVKVEQLKPTQQELAIMLKAVILDELNTLYGKRAEYNIRMTDMLDDSLKEIDKETWLQQWNELNTKIQLVQNKIDQLESHLGFNKKRATSRFAFAQ